jgi:hypothetical protein
MSWVPPFNLDPHVAVRAPETMPVLMQRGVYDLIDRWKHGEKNKHSEGDEDDRFMRAFNYIAKRLTDTGFLRRGTLHLTPTGLAREKEVGHLKDTKTKLYWLKRWADKLKARDPERFALTWWQWRDKEGS